MASKQSDPCVHCDHPLRDHRRGRSDPKDVYVCDCGCAIEFEKVS